MNIYVALGTTVVLSFLIAFLLGFVLIPWLRKLKFGQTILDIGPAWHKSKQGTPIMGGIMFIVAIVTVTVVSTIIYIVNGDSLASSFTADIPKVVQWLDGNVPSWLGWAKEIFKFYIQ